MNIKNEFLYDFDITGAKVTLTDRVAVIGNVKRMVTISDTQITCETIRFYVSIIGENLQLGEIWEGRVELAGKIRGLEIYKSQSQN